MASDLMPLERIAQPLLALPRPAKRALALTFDVALCALTLWIALSLRFEQLYGLTRPYLVALLVSVALALPLFIVHGFYRAIFRYAGWNAMISVLRAVGIYGLLFASLFTLIGMAGIPRSVGIMQPLLLMLTVGGSRWLLRHWLGGGYRQALKLGTSPGVLIYGAGSAGRQLAVAQCARAQAPARLPG